MDLDELKKQLSFDTSTNPKSKSTTMPHTRGVVRRSRVTSVTISPEHIEALKIIGDGNISRGIKRLLNEHLKNKK